MDLNNLTKIGIKAAVLAGEEIMKIYLDPNSDFGIERKSDNSPLTIADKKSNETIIGFLKDTIYPCENYRFRILCNCHMHSL